MCVCEKLCVHKCVYMFVTNVSLFPSLPPSFSQVEGLNSKWQKYDSSREAYVRYLCQKLNESSALAVTSSPVPGVGHRVGPGPTQEPGAGLGLFPELASAKAGLLQQEIARLNGLLEEKLGDCGRLGRELDESRRRYKDRIQMLEQQVSVV